MADVDVIAVVGACAPERAQYARGLAERTDRAFVPARSLLAAREPVEEAIERARSAGRAAGAVVEVPLEVAATDVVGGLADPEGATRLVALVCVLDAAHLLDDLGDGTWVVRAGHGSAGERTARASLAVEQIEYASMIVLVNWSALSRSELTTIMSLVSHVSPHARVRLRSGSVGPVDVSRPYTRTQERPGWVGLLNDDHDPHMRDRRVSGFRYENLRPFHPGRLRRLLKERIERRAFGSVIRSAGFCRLATRPHVTAHWDHVGRMMSLAPLAHDDELEEGGEPLAFGQDLAIIGLDLDRAALAAALDGATLTDAELAAGPLAWAGFPDPFPAWEISPDRAE